MQKTCEILFVEKRDFINKRTLKPGVLPLAQCVIRETDGSVKIGELLLPEEFKDTQPGTYTLGFDLDVSFDKRIGSRVVSITPLKPAAVVSPKAA